MTELILINNPLNVIQISIMKTTGCRLQTKDCRKATVSSLSEFSERGGGKEKKRKESKESSMYILGEQLSSQIAHVS